MAHKKAAGSTKNTSSSNPQYLGIKVNNGQNVKAGSVLVRQRGTKYLPGKNVRSGKDHTLFTTVDGKVSYGDKRKKHFDGKTVLKKIVSVN